MVCEGGCVHGFLLGLFLVLPRVGVWLYYTDTMAVVNGIFVFLLCFYCFFVVFLGFLLYFGGA